MKRLAVVGLMTLVGLATGCQGKDKLYPVTGKVTFDGKPVEDGHIVFRSAGNAGGQSGEVVDGEFEFEATAGKKSVYITASRPINSSALTGSARDTEEKMKKAMGGSSREQYIPDRYNVKTTLEAEVAPSGPNQFTFKLTSRP
jgi:hypothetical protein